MRIDLHRGGRRPLLLGWFLRLVRWYVGVDSGPPTALSFRPDLFGRTIRGYILSSSRPSGSWDKGELEMFSAFVSKLNQCKF